CWAHLLRKAIKLTLQEPANQEYRQFTDRLLEIYRAACRVQRDGRLSAAGRVGKVVGLDEEIVDLCMPMWSLELPPLEDGPENDSCECVGIATSVLAEIHARQCHGRDRLLAAGGPKLLHQAAEENETATARPIHSRQSHAGPRQLTTSENKIPTTPNPLCKRP